MTITLLSLPAQGNARYRRGDLEGALGAYTVGVDTEGCSSELVALLSNRSACLCDLGRWEEALVDARRCVLVGPKPKPCVCVCCSAGNACSIPPYSPCAATVCVCVCVSVCVCELVCVVLLEMHVASHRIVRVQHLCVCVCVLHPNP